MRRRFALLVPLPILFFAGLAGCPSSVKEAGASGTTAAGGSATGATTTGATTTSATSGTTGTGGATSGTTTTDTTTSSTTTDTTTTTSVGGCGATTCTAGQLCVVPACKQVFGESCYQGTPDAGVYSCPPGEKRGVQFDVDCLQPGYACVGGCPPAPPFCVDLPPACGGVPTCGCLASDPCYPSNSGACHDADIVGLVLTCSLMP